MDYWRVHWHHDVADEPVTIWNEIGDDGYEVRKVHHYRDGRALRTDARHENGEIGLGVVPVGELRDVQAQPEFSATAVTRREFEAVWSGAAWPEPGPTP